LIWTPEGEREGNVWLLVDDPRRCMEMYDITSVVVGDMALQVYGDNGYMIWPPRR